MTDGERKEISPPLPKNHLASTRPKDVPQHAENSLVAVDAENKQAFIRLLERRMGEMSKTQAARVRKVMRAAAMG